MDIGGCNAAALADSKVLLLDTDTARKNNKSYYFNYILNFNQNDYIYLHIDHWLTGGGSQGSGGGQQGKTGGQQTGVGGGGGQGSEYGFLRGLQDGNKGTNGGTKSGMTGSGHGLNTGLQIQGGQGVQGTGGGQQGWQQGCGEEQLKKHGPEPHGRMVGQVGLKSVEHITNYIVNYTIDVYMS